jgi:hypothetical protein
MDNGRAARTTTHIERQSDGWKAVAFRIATFIWNLLTALIHLYRITLEQAVNIAACFRAEIAADSAQALS